MARHEKGAKVHVAAEVERAIKKVAHEHFDIEESLHVIAVYSNSFKNKFLFIEVNDNAIPVGYVEPLCFAPSHEFAWPLYIADVTRDEWAQIVCKEMPLPEGWLSTPIYVFPARVRQDNESRLNLAQ